jgi:hypothetical protein
VRALSRCGLPFVLAAAIVIFTSASQNEAIGLQIIHEGKSGSIPVVEYVSIFHITHKPNSLCLGVEYTRKFVPWLRFASSWHNEYSRWEQFWLRSEWIYRIRIGVPVVSYLKSCGVCDQLRWRSAVVNEYKLYRPDIYRNCSSLAALFGNLYSLYNFDSYKGSFQVDDPLFCNIGTSCGYISRPFCQLRLLSGNKYENSCKDSHDGGGDGINSVVGLLKACANIDEKQPNAIEGAIFVIGIVIAIIAAVWIVTTTPKGTDAKNHEEKVD